MAPTQGFTLSALPRAPRVPENIGVLDMKAIDEGVRRGLETFEMVRRAPRSMILADATADAGTAKQRSVLAQLPLEQRQLVAQTDAMERDLPRKSNILASQETVAAAQATPEYLEAQRQALLLKNVPADIRTLNAITQGMTPEQAEQARRVKAGLQARPSSAAIQYREVVGPDGITRQVAFDPRAVGAHVVGSGEQYGTGVQPPSVPIEMTAVATDESGASTALPSNPNLFQSPTIQQAAGQKASGEKSAEAVVEARTKLPKAKASLDSLESKTERINADIEEAIQLAPGGSGFASLLKRIPTTQAMKLDGILTSIRANSGFDTLTEMRQNSPTGGALGNVSDFEGRNLQSAIAELNQAFDDKTLISALRKVQRARAEALDRTRNQFNREAQFFGLGTDAEALGAPATPSSSSGEYKIIEIR